MSTGHPSGSPRWHRVVLLLFLVSGACGLVYEVVWSRILTQVFGATALAVGTVLAAFMSGLAAGAWLLGRRGDRTDNPLRLYALYEVGIGLSALAALYLMHLIAPVYGWMSATFSASLPLLAFIRFAIAFLLVMIPTVLMGATLPILSRFLMSSTSRVGRDLGTLYAINTAGAVAGGLLAGFYLIGALGVHGTVLLAAAGNLAVGAISFGLARVAPGRRRAPDEPSAPAARTAGAVEIGAGEYRLLLLAFALSGFASFAYEVFWTRSLVFLLGNSTYAFTLMLTAFLSGIALGGYGIRFLADRVEHPVALFGWLEILIGCSSAAAVPLLFAIVHSESVRGFLVRMSGSMSLLFVSRFGLALLVMLVPATLIGATFPLVGRVCVRDLSSTGRDTGRIYAVNTAGNILGALLPGVLILPVAGIQGGMLLLASLNVSIGVAVLLARRDRSGVWRFAAPAVFAGLCLLIASVPAGFQFPSQYQSPRHEVLYYRDGPSATTKVFMEPDTREKLMSIDGVVIGGTGIIDYKQQILAHLPKLLLDDYSTELTVGLGSGILAGESARHSRLQRIVCVEIEPTVIEGAELFSRENHGILDDPRMEIVQDDVASYLRASTRRFDMISADEKTAENYASNGFSYSMDYYRLLRDHLAPGGLVVQWIPADLPPRQFAMALHTFTEAFPFVSVWYFPPVGKFGPSNVILVGSSGEIRIDPAGIARRLEREQEAFRGLRKYGLTTAEALLAHHVTGRPNVREAVAGAPLNSLENPRYEFYSPGDYAVPAHQRALGNHDLLVSLREPPPAAARHPRVALAFEAEQAFLEGFRLMLRGAGEAEISAAFDAAVARAPWNDNLRYQVLLYYWNMAGTYYLDGDNASALALMRKAVQTYAKDGEVQYYHGLILEANGRAEEAAEAWRRAIALGPWLLSPRRALASHLLATGRREEAEALLESVLAVEPDDVFSLVQYGMSLAERSAGYAPALEHLSRAYAIAPDRPSVVDGMAWVTYLNGNRAEARRIVHEGGLYYAGDPRMQRRRNIILKD